MRIEEIDKSLTECSRLLNTVGAVGSGRPKRQLDNRINNLLDRRLVCMKERDAPKKAKREPR